MATDGQAAHGYLLDFEPLAKHGYCWYYVWRAYALAGARTSMGSTPTAYAAWSVTEGKHFDMNPPAGAAIWLGRRYRDGNMDGDVFIAGGINGDKSAATDYPGWGDTGLVSIQGRINQTGREYLGWTDHILDVPIIMASTPTPDPTPDPTPTQQDDLMKIFAVSGSFFFATPRGLVGISNPNHLELLRRFVASVPGAEPWFTPGERDVINDYLTKPVLSWSDLNPA